MRHRRRTRKLGFKTAHRQAVMHNMVSSLIQHGRIITTVPRAKELRRIADHMITLAKKGTVHARRQAYDIVQSRDVVKRLFTYWGPKFIERPGGYTRIVRAGQRRGDAAAISIVEFVAEGLEKAKTRAPRRPIRPQVSAPSVVPAAVPSAQTGSPAPSSADAAKSEAPTENTQEASAERSMETSSEALSAEDQPPGENIS